MDRPHAFSEPVRKIGVYVEQFYGTNPALGESPVRRGYAAAVLAGAAHCSTDLERAAKAGEWLGDILTGQLLAALNWTEGTPLAYGKAALIGSACLMEDAAAILHPLMGAALRNRIGQGRSIIPSTVKRGAADVRIDIPLHGARDEWDFALLDSIEATVNDAPLPSEIVVFVALAIGRRADAVVGANRP